MDSYLLSMQDQQRKLLDSYPSSTCSDSVYATPCSADGRRQSMMAYYVESPSTVVDMSSVDELELDRRGTGSSEAAFSASLLSRSTSFLSNCTSEAVSLPDVSARLQSWCKSRPPPSLVTWETRTSSTTCSSDELEAGYLPGDHSHLCCRTRCCDVLKSLVFCLCLTVSLTALLLAVSASMYWLVCHPHAPRTVFKGLEFRRFHVQQGYDRTGVPTDMVNLESLVMLSVANPSRHFGAYVSGATVDLYYLPRPIAHGQVPHFYQDCHSERNFIIKATSEYEPLYGAGPSLQQAMLENRQIALGLTISVKSHVNLFGNCEPPKRLRQGGDIRRFLRRHSP